jgi:hypothetical protein
VTEKIVNQISHYLHFWLWLSESYQLFFFLAAKVTFCYSQQYLHISVARVVWEWGLPIRVGKLGCLERGRVFSIAAGDEKYNFCLHH